MQHITNQGLDWILRAAEKERERGDDGPDDKEPPKEENLNKEDMKVKELTIEEQE